MHFKNMIPSALIILSVFACNSQSIDPNTLISDDFSNKSNSWQKIDLKGDLNAKYEISGGQLQLFSEGPLLGVYHKQSIGGHFLVETEFSKDKNVGLLLIHDKNGIPDTQNYTMLCVDTDPDGLVEVYIQDCQNGQTNVLDNTGLTEFDPERIADEEFDERLGNDLYRHVLTGNQYSVPFTQTDKKIRIFREANSGFLHFYYAVRQVIHGKEVSDWMEIRPSKDWAADGSTYFIGLVSLDKGETVFNSVRVTLKPQNDKNDTATGFALTNRDYNWSGFYGNAVVVSFDSAFAYHEKDIKFVFWTEMNFIPAWHIDNQLLYTYEFVETWGGGEEGCHEPMSDRLRRWTSVEIVEDNPVRKVIHWHYVLCNPDYRYPDNDRGEQAPEVDEYFTFYPDGSGTRHIRYTPKLDTDFRAPHELGELISIAGSKTSSGPLHARPALTMLNLEGEIRQAHPGPKFDYYSPIDDWNQQIKAVHLTDGPDVFCAWSVDPRVPETYSGYKIRYENAWQNPDINPVHWPVNKRPYTRYFSSPGTWDAEVSHACLLSFGVRDGIDWQDHFQVDEHGRKYREWVSLIGLNEPKDLEMLKLKTRSWLFPGEILINDSNCEFIGVDYQKKCLLFRMNPAADRCGFEIKKTLYSEKLINPVIEIKSWNHSEMGQLLINNQRVSPERYRTTFPGDSRLLLWLEAELIAGDVIELRKS